MEEVTFSNISSPRPRKEDEHNDSFQLVLAIEEVRQCLTLGNSETAQ